MSHTKRVRAKVSEETRLKNQLYIQQIRQHVEDRYSLWGITPRFFIDTYGCQMNEHDSETLTAMLFEMGYQSCDEEKDANLIIINTCCVRENAEMKVFGNLGHLKPVKKKKKDLKIAVCGCMMQQPHVVEHIQKHHPFVDLIFGTHNLHDFPQLFMKTFETRTQIIDVWENEGDIVEGLPSIRKTDQKAYINIMFGCDNFCSYCIVPYTRGRERSRLPEDIVAEATALIRDGVKEITLLGQNVNSYGAGLDRPITFAELLRQIDAIPGIERIRFMTSHPKDVSDELIQAMAECPHVCEHMHLPVQAGSDRLLKAMNRVYTRAEYLAVVKKLKAAIPDIRISTDIIVGFPGETEEDVDQLIDLIHEVEYESAFTFLYSLRKGTPAAELAEQIDDVDKHRRFDRMLKALNAMVAEQNRRMKGSVVEVLAENSSKQDETLINGRTRGNQLVAFKGEPSDIGQLIMVEITEPRSFSLYGIKRM